MKPQRARLLGSGKKILAAWLVGNATLWVYLSYLLAFLGREDIAETLSSNVVTSIIVIFATYAVSSTVENVFKYNEIGGKSADVDC